MARRLVPLLFTGLLTAGCSQSDATASTREPTPGASPSDATTPVDAAGSATTTVLANGMRLLVTPIADATTVAVVVTFEVGSRHDPPGRSGLAHFAEHLLVTAATSAEPARIVDELIARYPLGWNAQTGADFTVIATVVDQGDLTGELTLMAARLAGVTPTAEDVDRERPRVLTEVDNMWGGIPSLATVNAAKERVAPTPHDGRRGGDPTALAAVTLDELIGWLGYYNPTNATLSIAGPVDAAAVTTSASSLFGAVPAGAHAPSPTAPPPGSSGITTIEADPADPGLVAVAYAAPEPGSDEFAPFLAAVYRLFDAGPTAGLTASYAPIDDPDALVVSAPLLAGERADDGAARLAREVVDIVTAPLADDELDVALAAFGPLLGLAPNPFNPYATAFAAARAAPLDLGPLDSAGLHGPAYDATIRRIFVDADLTGAAMLSDPSS